MSEIFLQRTLSKVKKNECVPFFKVSALQKYGILSFIKNIKGYKLMNSITPLNEILHVIAQKQQHNIYKSIICKILSTFLLDIKACMKSKVFRYVE